MQNFHAWTLLRRPAFKHLLASIEGAKVRKIKKSIISKKVIVIYIKKGDIESDNKGIKTKRSIKKFYKKIIKRTVEKPTKYTTKQHKNQ